MSETEVTTTISKPTIRTFVYQHQIRIKGQNDYYVMRYMQYLLGNNELHILPGTSSSNLECPIRLYSAWGRQFLVLLDSDDEGKKQKSRYEEIFESLLSNRVFTLSDVNASWQNGEMELLVTDADKLMIQKLAYVDEQHISKKHFNRAIQELLLKKLKVEISLETKNNFHSLFTFLTTKLKENHEN